MSICRINRPENDSFYSANEEKLGYIYTLWEKKTPQLKSGEALFVHATSTCGWYTLHGLERYRGDGVLNERHRNYVCVQKHSIHRNCTVHEPVSGKGIHFWAKSSAGTLSKGDFKINRIILFSKVLTAISYAFLYGRTFYRPVQIQCWCSESYTGKPIMFLLLKSIVLLSSCTIPAFQAFFY